MSPPHPSSEQCFKLSQNWGETQQKLLDPETSIGRTGAVIVPQNRVELLKKVVRKSHM